MERAASITPGSTDMRFCSTMRATANSAAIVMAKIAAFCPSLVPITVSVSGPRAASRMSGMVSASSFAERPFTHPGPASSATVAM